MLNDELYGLIEMDQNGNLIIKSEDPSQELELFQRQKIESRNIKDEFI